MRVLLAMLGVVAGCGDLIGLDTEKVVMTSGVTMATARQSASGELIFQLVAFEGGTPP